MNNQLITQNYGKKRNASLSNSGTIKCLTRALQKTFTKMKSRNLIRSLRLTNQNPLSARVKCLIIPQSSKISVIYPRLFTITVAKTN